MRMSTHMSMHIPMRMPMSIHMRMWVKRARRFLSRLTLGCTAHVRPRLRSIAVDFLTATPSAVSKLVMLDPAVYTAAPPVVPEFAAKLLIDNVIGAPKVRESIALQAYFDKPAQTEDAIRVGMLHVARPEWSRDSVEWLLLGGYDVQQLMPSLSGLPCLTLWGRQDEVIRPSDAVPKLVAALPNAEFRWVESCGHTPHLEQPATTAEAIVRFMRGEEVQGDSDTSSAQSSRFPWFGF